jgi:release factor glutamine methyltransferase
MNVREALSWAVQELAAAGVDAPRMSAELLACKALGLSRLELILKDRDPQSDSALSHFRELLARRAAGEPAAYILGEREFYGLPFAVTPAVLIPRPETEHIIELAVAHFPRDTELLFADFGTGSGILAVTLAHEFPRSRGFAIDLSAEALGVAQANARALGVADRLQFVQADMTRPLLFPGSCQLIVSNPPYVTEPEYAEISAEVRSYEPRLALVSPEDGLVHLRGLLRAVAPALQCGGLFLAEIGSGQGPGARDAVKGCAPGLGRGEIIQDYSGLDRVLRVGAGVA